MSAENVIKIPRSKTKLVFALVVCLFAIVFGFFCVFRPNSFGYNMPFLIIILGVVCILLFGFFGFCLVRWLFNDKPGLVIDSEGITDNTVQGQENRILWSDVADITEWKYMSQKLAVVVLKDPHCYIDGHPRQGHRKAMLMNLKMCGSPVALSASVLKISHKNLYKLLYDNFVKYTQINT